MTGKITHLTQRHSLLGKLLYYIQLLKSHFESSNMNLIECSQLSEVGAGSVILTLQMRLRMVK